MDIPVCFGEDAVFIGWQQLWDNTKVGNIIILISIFIEYLLYCYLKIRWKHQSQELSVQIVEIKERNYEMVMFIASFFVPLVSFQLHQASNWIVLVILFVSIGIIFCKSTGFYNNPTLALLGFHFYDVIVKTQKEGNDKKESWVILSKESLNIDDRIKYVKLSNGIGMATIFK